jgi:hypothetical protein
MTSGQGSENRRLTARERWLKEHKEVRFYLRHDEYELLESQASEEGLTVKDYVLKIARDLQQLKQKTPALETLGCKPNNVVECVNKTLELWEKLVVRSLDLALEHEACLKRLKEYEELLKFILRVRGGWRSSGNIV